MHNRRNALTAAVMFALSSAAQAGGHLILRAGERISTAIASSTSQPQMTFGYKGAGITMAQQKRASRKVKNVKRHRAACRG